MIPYQKIRLPLGWVLGAAIILLVDQFPTWPSISCFLLGCIIRVWASGYLKKNNVLTIDGPYHFTRNPLYLGSFLMIVGASMAANYWWLTAITAVLFLTAYYGTIFIEEKVLAGLFGANYAFYKKQVSRFLPWRLFCFKRTSSVEEKQKFSWELSFKRNRAYEAFIVFFGFYFLIYSVVFLKMKLF